MQKVKKFLAAVLVAVMMLSLGSGMVNTEAQAAGETGKITINNAEQGKSYKAYRIFDLSKSTDGSKFSYRIADNWKAFFEKGQDGANYVTTDESGFVSPNITEKNKVDFSKIAQQYAIKNSVAVDGTVQASGTTAEITNLPYGYYLVFEETAGAEVPVATLINVNDANVEMTPKGKVPTIEKTADKETADVGEIVKFTIKGKVPDTTGYNKYIYTVRDTMKGLALTGDYTVTINGVVVEKKLATAQQPDPDDENITAGKDDVLPTAGATSFALNIDMTKYQGDKIGTDVIIEYTAKVTKTDNGLGQNDAKLEYSNNPKEDTSIGTSTPPSVTVKNYDVEILKHETGQESTTLADAKFVLYKKEVSGKILYYHVNENGEVSWSELGQNGVPGDLTAAIPKHVTEVTTDALGKASFTGLAEGKYFLKETQAPNGYNIMAEDKGFTIEKNNESNKVSVKVPNSTGTELPGTGGIGNTIFYIVGGALMLAGVVLLMRKRAK